jgi:hypothetical protein
MAQAVRSGDEDRAKELSIVREQAKKEQHKWCSCGNRKNPKCRNCGLCAAMLRKPKLVVLPDYRPPVKKSKPSFSKVPARRMCRYVLCTRWFQPEHDLQRYCRVPCSRAQRTYRQKINAKSG